jgi:acetylxylan esterase
LPRFEAKSKRLDNIFSLWKIIVSTAMAYFVMMLASILWFGLVAGLSSTLQQVTDFGINPTNVGMFVYIPTNVTANPAVVVAIHDCNGTAETYFSYSPYAQFADTYGFIVIYPSSPNAGTCWDLTSPATLSHDGGGDSQGIASMVGYAISTSNADPTRISVTGTASGGTV